MVKYSYRTKGVCSSSIEFSLDDGLVRNVAFCGGCDGNLKGISKLVEGRDALEVIGLLEGNTCGRKPTSCPDQLASALKSALANE